MKFTAKSRAVLAAVLIAAALAGGGAWFRGRTAEAVELPPEPDTVFGDQKAVYHLVDGAGFLNRNVKRWLANMENHRNALGLDHLDLVVVMNGDGVDLLITARNDPAVASHIDELKKYGAKFLVCRKTLESRRLDWRKDLYDVRPEDVVVSGMPTVVALERQGYAYMRP